MTFTISDQYLDDMIVYKLNYRLGSFPDQYSRK